MRVDYFHTGALNGEVISLDRVVADGPWSGSLTYLADDSNFGKYLFEVRSADTGELLYSRGFASIYGEWETTGEARSIHRTFHESLRFPWPRAPVLVSLLKRNADLGFDPIWATEIDPASRCVKPADLTPAGGAAT